ncbi:MAG: murein biosynthesis integral membrane protein MurJ [gamma proteobacterium symbiont of Bathyaustriella thionipta]|nr:murein biosynthesis integral membrane protein MurJ [gamma proteobacterium symbiont of Bathyaustriella thionipta]
MASFIRSIASTGSNTLISRILGFIRDVVLAHVFGAGAATDAFFVAFKIPNFLRRLFAEGAFSVAFVPVLSEYQSKRSFAELQLFVSRVSGTLGAILLLVTVAGVLGAPLLATVFAPGFLHDPLKHQLTVDMLRLTFPYLFFISLTAFAGGILNAHQRFGVPAFTPVLLNLSLIGCALLLSPRMQQPVVALAWGVLIAGIAQFVFQLPFLARMRLLRPPSFKPADEGVRRIGKLMIPALFGVSVTQLNLLLDVLIASFLVSGSISWLYYSDRLMEFPLGVLGVALGTVILPSLSRRHAEQNQRDFSHTLDWALRWVLFFGAPAAVGLLMLASPMIATLFYSDKFTQTDVLFSTRSLMAYSLGLLPFMLIKVLAPAYYARLDTKTPVRIGIMALFANMAFNLILVWPLAHAGLALATTLSASLNAGLLFRGLRKAGIYQPDHSWRFSLTRILLACLLMAACLYWLTPPLQDWLLLSAWQRAIQLGWIILAAAGVYFATLLACGIRLRHFRSGASL